MTSPIRVKGSSLVLHFETPTDDPSALTLTGKDAPDAEALVDVEDGNLEITHGTLRLLNQKWAALPRRLLRVRGGDLRLYGCRLTGPLSRAPAGFQTLIAFHGSGRTEADRAQECLIVDSMLASGKRCLRSVGVGARLRLHNNVFIAGEDVLYLDPGPAPDQWRILAALLPAWCEAFERDLHFAPRARLNAQCLLENNTLALRGPAVRLGDAPDVAVPPAEPFVVKANGNVFCDPFAGSTRQAGLVTFEGDALARGLLVWQGDGNAYDKGLRYGLVPADKPAETPQVYATWARRWGSAGDRQAVLFDVTGAERKLNLDFPKLASLAPPAGLRAKAKGALPGSDLVKKK
jgi:hypothetical protein